ncbi:MAG: protein kinase [Gemmataceae bacterium]|nr:protein kinase [Gemmataceae bacterium]
MQPVNANANNLPPEQQELLAKWLREFEQGWEEGALPRRANSLPEDVPLRQLALVGLVKIDLKRSWQQGRKRPLEAYLVAFPALGTPDTIPIDLIQAEIQARRQAGDSVSFADLTRRFPRQMEQLQRGLQHLCEGSPTATAAPPPHATTATAFGNITDTTAGLPPSPSPSEQPSITEVVPPTAQTVSLTNQTVIPVGPARSADESGSEELHTLRPAQAEPESETDLSEVTRKAPTSTSRYHILKELGRGAMGTVYLAQDTHLQRQVAMKVPHFRPGDGPEMLARFYREARSAATLDHPNICPVYDVGENGGIPYLTMAFVEGQPLTEVMARERPMAPYRAAEIVFKLARALEEAHRRSIIHRDLKPSNVMMNRRGEPVVMDFGLARRVDQDTGLTQQGSILGTPAYMPPEQVQGDLDAIGPASDVYSLGVILYELLTGQVPFQGSMGQVMAQIVSEIPPPPRHLRPDLDPRLEKICVKAMSPAIRDRYASMGEFAKELATYLQITSKSSPDFIVEPQRPDPDLRTDTISLEPQLPPEQIMRDRRRKRRLLATGVAAAIVAILAGVVALILVFFWPWPVTIAIHTTPRDATVFLDNEPRERQADGTLAVRPGEHQLRVEHREYEPLHGRLAVRAEDGGRTFDYQLTPLADLGKAQEPVPVLVRTTPGGATLFLRGIEQKERSGDTLRLRPGKHQVRAVLAGYQPLEKLVEVQAAPKAPPQVVDLGSFKRLRGKLTVDTKPRGATVTVRTLEGEPVKLVAAPGVTPTTLDLEVGNYSLEFRLTGYVASTVAVTVREGKQTLSPLPVLDAQAREKYALLVGVHKPNGNLPDFLHAEPDVVELGQLLVAGGYPEKHVVVLTQTLGDQKDAQLRPTAANIQAHLQALTTKCTASDSLLVALVGHAVQLDDGGPSYFCPADAVLNNKQDLVSLTKVYEELNRSKAGAKFLVLDCWRKDLRAQPPKAPLELKPGRPTQVVPTGAVPVLLSCSAKELGYEHPDRRHGAFTVALLRDLLSAGDGTVGGLAKAVAADVADAVRSEYGASQTPELVAVRPTAPRPELNLKGALADYRQGCAHLDRATGLKSTKERTLEYQQAIEALTRAEAAAPQFPAIYTRRAAAHYYRGKYELAAADCRKALQLDPYNATAHAYLADSLAELKQFDDAFKHHDRAIKLEPEYGQGYFSRGRTHYLKAEFLQSITEFKHALHLNPRLKWAQTNLGFALMSQPKPNMNLAIDALTAALKIDPDLPEALYGRGIAHTLTKQYKPAIKDLTRAIEVTRDSPDPEFYAWRARAFAGDQQPMRAEEDRKKAKELMGMGG